MSDQARDAEVDSLRRGEREDLATEIRPQIARRRPQLAALRALADSPPLIRRVRVYLGVRPLKTADGIRVSPLETSLAAVGAALFTWLGGSERQSEYTVPQVRQR